MKLRINRKHTVYVVERKYWYGWERVCEYQHGSFCWPYIFETIEQAKNFSKDYATDPKKYKAINKDPRKDDFKPIDVVL